MVGVQHCQNGCGSVFVHSGVKHITETSPSVRALDHRSGRLDSVLPLCSPGMLTEMCLVVFSEVTCTNKVPVVTGLHLSGAEIFLLVSLAQQ